MTRACLRRLAFIWPLFVVAACGSGRVPAEPAGEAVSRRIEGRLAGKPHLRYSEPSRVFLQRAADSMASADIAASHQPIGSVTADDVARVAARELDKGRLDSAIALYGSIAESQRPEIVSTNLSAAYLAAWFATPESARHLVWALDAALKATEANPSRSEGWFNLAVILGHLGLDPQARRAWERWATVERDAAWRAEGEQRAGQLSLESAAARWEGTRSRLMLPDAAVTESFVTTETSRAPQAARELLQDELLPKWSEAWLAGRRSEADTLLQRSAWITAALQRSSGDTLDVRTVSLIARASGQHPGREPAGREEAGREAAQSATARGLIAYGEGRRHYEANAWEAAGRSFRTSHAELAAGRSPMAVWASIQQALMLYQARRLTDTRRVLTAARRESEAHGYLTALMRVHWLDGLVSMQQGDIERAEEAYRRSTSIAQRVGEAENAAAVAGTAADTLRLSADYETGWRFLRVALMHLRDVRSVRRRFTLLLNASLYASDEELPAAALFLQNASLEAARERGVPSTIAEGLIRRATLHSRRGDVTRAMADLGAAKELIPQIQSQSSREYQQAWWSTASGEVYVASDASRAQESIRGALDYFTRTEPAEVPRLHLLQGRAHLARGDVSAAEQAFLRGAAVFNARWRQLAREERQMAYLDESWSLFQQLIELYVERGDFDRAFRQAESVRGRTLTGEPGVIETVGAVQRVLSNDIAFVYYALLDRHLAIWCVTRQSANVKVVDADVAAVARDISIYRRLLEAGADPNRVKQLARSLHTRLVAPVSDRLKGIDTLVVVGDGPVHAVPFATLIDNTTGRYLVEDYAVVMAPNAAEFLRASTKLTARRPRAPRALIVGVSDPPEGLELPRLPDTSREVTEVASMYGTAASTLVDRQAMPAQVARAIPAYDVFHFAGHARANLRFPAASLLVLTPDATHPHGTLAAGEIAKLNLSSVRLVALSACRTAYGAIYRGEGTISLARPFLSAGVPNVVGSLWDVSDSAARRLLTTFHRQFLASGNAVTALRAAQLDTLRDPAGRWREASHWGAFAVIGGVPLSR